MMLVAMQGPGHVPGGRAGRARHAAPDLERPGRARGPVQHLAHALLLVYHPQLPRGAAATPASLWRFE